MSILLGLELQEQALGKLRLLTEFWLLCSDGFSFEPSAAKDEAPVHVICVLFIFHRKFSLLG